MSSSAARQKKVSNMNFESDPTEPVVLDKLEENGTKTNISRIQGYVAEPVDLQQLKKHYAGHKQGRRVAPRYSVLMDVILFTNMKSFRTSSINVSASGALLKDSLPVDFMDGSLDVVFVVHKGNVRKHMIFRGKAVGGPLRSPRITFLESALNSQTTLMSLFEDLTPLGETYDK